jgi:hypothetical protein
VMLPVTECDARMVDIELDVSEDIVDSGRGMNSMVSEKPTRGRLGVGELAKGMSDPFGVAGGVLSACEVFREGCDAA